MIRGSSTPPQLDPHDNQHHHSQHHILEDQHGLHENLNQLHGALIGTRDSLMDGHNQIHDGQLRSGPNMDDESHFAVNDSHISHGGPLTPQLTPVSQCGSGITSMLAGDRGECIKTEVRTQLKSVNFDKA